MAEKRRWKNEKCIHARIVVKNREHFGFGGKNVTLVTLLLGFELHLISMDGSLGFTVKIVLI